MENIMHKVQCPCGTEFESSEPGEGQLCLECRTAEWEEEQRWKMKRRSGRQTSGSSE